jgi:hypothetical protein
LLVEIERKQRILKIPQILYRLFGYFDLPEKMEWKKLR